MKKFVNCISVPDTAEIDGLTQKFSVKYFNSFVNFEYSYETEKAWINEADINPGWQNC